MKTGESEYSQFMYAVVTREKVLNTCGALVLSFLKDRTPKKQTIVMRWFYGMMKTGMKEFFGIEYDQEAIWKRTIILLLKTGGISEDRENETYTITDAGLEFISPDRPKDKTPLLIVNLHKPMGQKIGYTSIIDTKHAIAAKQRDAGITGESYVSRMVRLTTAIPGYRKQMDNLTIPINKPKKKKKNKQKTTSPENNSQENPTQKIELLEVTEIDTLLIHTHGIFVLESKQMSGSITGSQTDKWICERPSIDAGEPQNLRFKNPVIQNKRHIAALARLLRLDKEMFFSVIIFPEWVKLQVPQYPADDQVYIMKRRRMTSGIAKIIKGESQKFSEEEVDKFYQILTNSARKLKNKKR